MLKMSESITYYSEEVENAHKILLEIKTIKQRIEQNICRMAQIKEETEDLLKSIEEEKEKLKKQRKKAQKGRNKNKQTIRKQPPDQQGEKTGTKGSEGQDIPII